ncbi:MAG TPA: ferritin [Acidobacteriota bacterium]|nr:ferritin [Acidobacteriota bacterium]HRR25530.1 ferritin [Acidobacteriota bacterium]HRR56749.1 ferritin [Acidobacteriota bacterium]HRV09104.1 ferritin [Acidobacteriota bacterium]
MWTKKLEKAFNEQLVAELNSAYVYLGIAAYFDATGLEGFAHWMKVQAKEETEHAAKFYDFILSRRGEVTLGKLDGPKVGFASALEAFNAALAHEQMITGRINDLLDLARKEKDPASEQFLMWFVEEQVEEEDSVRKVIDKLELVGDSSNGLFMMDRELARRGA